jgi:hypothetical protein
MGKKNNTQKPKEAEAPEAEAPEAEAPEAEAPEAEAPEAEAPEAEAPEAEAPEAEAPEAEAPEAEAPEAEAPSTDPRALLLVSSHPRKLVEIISIIDVSIPAGEYKKVSLANGTTYTLSQAELSELLVVE